MKPYMQVDLKDLNRKTVFKLVSTTENLSKAEISRITGISAPTVIKIIQYFIDQGFVEEIGEGESLIGRKPKLLKFNANAYQSIGIEWNGDELRIGLINLSGKLSHLKVIPLEYPFLDMLQHHLPTIIENYIETCHISKKQILGLGIGIPGIVDSIQNEIKVAPIIGIHEPLSVNNMINKLIKQLGFPILIENDVNAAVIGEFVTRKLGYKDDLLYISMGKGIGAGIILEGKLRRGPRHLAGEIGYMVFDPHFKTERSQPGWLESQEHYQTCVQQKYENNDINQNILDKVTRDLGMMISNVVTALDINQVVIGGHLSQFDQPLIHLINKFVNQYCIVEVLCEASLSLAPGIVGMGKLITEEVLDKRLID